MKRKILCLDGGGIKGLFTAQFLAEIEEKLDLFIFEYFDMIVGTSTGGIIAAALALGIPARTICELYIRHAKEIFPTNNRFLSSLKRISGAKYENDALKGQLYHIFEDKTIGSCKTRLLIPSYNLTTGKVQVFKTAHSPDLYYDKCKKILDVLLSTTAAPTFLPPYNSENGTYIDGGIGAVNPSFIGIVEAVTRCSWDLNDIYLLSLGCMEPADNASTGREKMGFINVGKLISLFMTAESQYSDNIARILLGVERYIRINPIDPHNRISLDGTKSDVLTYLRQMGIQQAQEHIEQTRKMFFDRKSEPLVQY